MCGTLLEFEARSVLRSPVTITSPSRIAGFASSLRCSAFIAQCSVLLCECWSQQIRRVYQYNQPNITSPQCVQREQSRNNMQMHTTLHSPLHEELTHTPTHTDKHTHLYTLT